MNNNYYQTPNKNPISCKNGGERIFEKQNP